MCETQPSQGRGVAPPPSSCSGSVSDTLSLSLSLSLLDKIASPIFSDIFLQRITEENQMYMGKIGKRERESCWRYRCLWNNKQRQSLQRKRKKQKMERKSEHDNICCLNMVQSDRRKDIWRWHKMEESFRSSHIPHLWLNR